MRTLASIATVLLLGAGGSALAAEPVFVFEKDGFPSTTDEKSLRFHDEYEKNGDFGESWFFMAQTADGGMFFGMGSVTNLGLRTFDGVCDVQYYPPEGKPLAFHRESKREDLKVLSAAPFEIRIGRCRILEGKGTYRFRFDDPEASADLVLQNGIPPYQFGNGAVFFGPEKKAFWSTGLLAPRAQASGQIKVGDRTISLAGTGYHDHGWSTVKVPSVFGRWFSLRVFDPKYSFVLHDQGLTEKYGGGANRFALLGTVDKVLAASRTVGWNPVKWRKDEKSGNRVPTELALDFQGDGWTVKGVVTESRFLDSIDVLGQVSWPVRVVIKAFYSKPYLIRYVGRYELDVTPKGGAPERISGFGLVETNYY